MARAKATKAKTAPTTASKAKQSTMGYEPPVLGSGLAGALKASDQGDAQGQAVIDRAHGVVNAAVKAGDIVFGTNFGTYKNIATTISDTIGKIKQTAPNDSKKNDPFLGSGLAGVLKDKEQGINTESNQGILDRANILGDLSIDVLGRAVGGIGGGAIAGALHKGFNWLVGMTQPDAPPSAEAQAKLGTIVDAFQNHVWTQPQKQRSNPQVVRLLHHKWSK